MGQNRSSKTLPYTLLFASGVVALVLVAGIVASGQFSIGPIAIVLFVATFIVVKGAFFKKDDVNHEK